ncbi:MAG: ABC transporter ATP-binding protein [Acidimicrobiales bacterium]
MSDLAISVEGLRKRYGEVVAADGVTFDVERGEIFGLLGRNGCGKTTTVECLQGLRRADGGKLRVLGLDPGRHGVELRRRIGAQLQESALPDRIKVGEALAFFASLVPGGPPWQEVMADWDLADKRDASFADLSGGQRQRLFVALAVVNQPELVFFDEMTTGLDPVSRHVAWELVDRLRQRGTTVVLVTHFMDEAEALCDRVAVFADHRVAAVGPPASLADRFGPTEVLFTAEGPTDFLLRTPDVDEVRTLGRQVTVTGSGAVLAHVAAALVTHGQAPVDLRARRPTLEDVFLRLTGDPGDDRAGAVPGPQERR